MLKKRKSQGSPITIIVAAVIGLIIIVVVVMMLTGKLGAFGKGVESANSCNNICISIGYDSGTGFGSDETCKSSADGSIKRKPVLGKFSDVKEDETCCCRKP